MQTRLADFIRDTAEGKEADAILRACVHCGFCTATCPTYQLIGDELDGPRGRIYLIKQMLETGAAGDTVRHYLDRCLTCRSCETTCPSGVRYGRLVEIGRAVVEDRAPRPLVDRIKRRALRWVVPEPRRIHVLMSVLNRLRWLMPTRYATQLPSFPRRREPSQIELDARLRGHDETHPRTMLLLEGCVQSVVTPHVNATARHLFGRLGITLVAAPEAGCCGALSTHLSARDEGLDYMRRNIDAWWPHIEAGAEAILVTASGCGAMVKDYGGALRDDPRYADKARRVSELARDPCEVLGAADLIRLGIKGHGRRIAFQSPCSLQHGQRLGGRIEALLRAVDFELVPVADGHLCCGSAGSYSVLQPETAEALRDNKLTALQAGKPEAIVTANIGCQMHLAGMSEVPVMHWLETLSEAATAELWAK
ncbi:MAG: glycolate oxidase subunit GlcF [Thiobacillus sp.]|nr:glycolate oxidase subunit GlcF [Thiobacillus sp.]